MSLLLFKPWFFKLIYKIAPLADFYYYLLLDFTPDLLKTTPGCNIAHFGKPWNLDGTLTHLNQNNDMVVITFLVNSALNVILKKFNQAHINCVVC